MPGENQELRKAGLKVTLPRDRMAKMASDHLPLVADLKIGFD